jgi:hypothetical protein
MRDDSLSVLKATSVRLGAARAMSFTTIVTCEMDALVALA